MTRMWMVDPKILCKNHLLGEHKEIHQLLGSIKRKIGITGYVKNNCVEVTSLVERHDILAEEIVRRGWNHKSPILYSQEDILKMACSYLPESEVQYIVDAKASLLDLKNRCSNCG